MAVFQLTFFDRADDGRQIGSHVFDVTAVTAAEAEAIARGQIPIVDGIDTELVSVQEM